MSALTRIGKVYSQLEQDFEREPTYEEIARVLEADPNEISYAIEKKPYSVSIDASYYSNNNSRLIDVLENQEEPMTDSKVLSQSLPEEVRIIINTLPKREARILKLYFGLDGEKPHTLNEIG